MIDECFLHCRGIGPKTSDSLKRAGYINWKDCISRSNELPFNGNKKESFISELEQSKLALDGEDINFFISKLPTYEHWRVLGYYFNRTTYFDIETTGLSWHYNHASVIVAYHKNKIHRFVYGENLDDFLYLIDDSELLVSFNGNCFDVPFLEKTFNIPFIGCPHLDLRWVAYHQGYRGGLKSIEREIGISRPSEVSDIDGFEAVDLYHRWQGGDTYARDKLINYCAVDVLSTYMLAVKLLNERGVLDFVLDMDEMFSMI